jgi:mRNA interferase HigB
MIVISKAGINKFIETYSKSAEPLLRWYLLCKENDWSTFSEMKKTFPAVDAVGTHDQYNEVKLSDL